jgi:hypothetical protein
MPFKVQDGMSEKDCMIERCSPSSDAEMHIDR